MGVIYIPSLIDLTGRKIGRWTVQYRNFDKQKEDKYNNVFWHCKCDCGNEGDIRTALLLSNQSKSCGCLHKELMSKLSIERHQNNRTKYDMSGEYGKGYTYNGYMFIFDKEDYDLIKQYNWFRNDQFYFLARVNIGNSIVKCVRLHRVIMKLNDDDKNEIDHIHGIESRYDNRKENLRVATHMQNNINKGTMSRNTSGYTGIDFNKRVNQWRARITINKKSINLGCFNDIEDAIKVRKEAEEKYFKEWSYDNSNRRQI